jgi:hypothetical protein
VEASKFQNEKPRGSKSKQETKQHNTKGHNEQSHFKWNRENELLHTFNTSTSTSLSLISTNPNYLLDDDSYTFRYPPIETSNLKIIIPMVNPKGEKTGVIYTAHVGRQTYTYIYIYIYIYICIYAYVRTSTSHKHCK